MKILSGYLLHL